MLLDTLECVRIVLAVAAHINGRMKLEYGKLMDMDRNNMKVRANLS